MAGADHQEVVTPEMRVAEVLRRWPHLLQELIDASPAFAKLKNPLLRRTMPALVTVAQAARIGGLEPEALVRRLNQKLGAGLARTAPVEEESLVGTPRPPWCSAAIGVHLDVRPVLEAGGEPFPEIMAAARRTEPGKRLVVEASFEPVPLYRALAKQGFVAWCERVGEKHYRAHFYRQEVATDASAKAAASPGPGDWEGFSAEVWIEENLEPPMPMMRVLEALAALEPGQKLLVHHVRRPVHLLARLEEDGHAYAINDLGPGRVEILIRKGG